MLKSEQIRLRRANKMRYVVGATGVSYPIMV